MQQLVAQINEAMRIADKGVENPMWFILVLFILLAMAYAAGLRWVAKYFIATHERLLSEHRVSRDSYTQALKEICNAYHELTVRVTESVTKCAAILEECNATLRKYDVK